MSEYRLPDNVPEILVFTDSQGRFLAVFLGPGRLDYAKVWEWAKRERGALVPHDLVGILQKDRRFRRLGQYRVVRIG